MSDPKKRKNGTMERGQWRWGYLVITLPVILCCGSLATNFTYSRLTGNVPCVYYTALGVGEVLTDIQLGEMRMLVRESTERLEVWVGSQRQCYVKYIPSYTHSQLADPVWSPDKTRFFVDGSLRLSDLKFPDRANAYYIVETDSGHITKLESIKGRLFSWTPDSSSLLFYTTGPAPIFLEVYDVQTDALTNIQIPAFPEAEELLWLDDTRLVATSYTRKGGTGSKPDWEATLIEVNIVTQEVRELPGTLNGEIIDVRLSDDGQAIAFTLDQSANTERITQDCRVDIATWDYECAA